MTTEGPQPSFPAMEGRVPLPTVLGAAPTVVGPDEPLRPDRSYTKLKWFSTLGGIIGLDHFYLRNPYSGFLKLITLGGFGVWWLWDAFQLWTEKNNVLLYGMSAPFDLVRGFGYGTITDDSTNYKQKSDSALWMFAAMLSPLGIDSMQLGNWGQMTRKLTEVVLLALFALPLYFIFLEEGIEGLLTIKNIFKALIAALIGFIVVSEWINVAGPTLLDPVGTFSNGIHISAKQDEVLNYQKAWIDNITLFGPDIRKQIKHDTSYKSLNGEQMRTQFKVRFVSPSDTIEEIAAEDAAEAAAAAQKEKNPVKWNWLLSYMSYLFGPFIILAQLIWNGIQKTINYFFSKSPLGAGLNVVSGIAEGKNPMDAIKEAALKAAGGIPGVSEGLKRAEGAAEKAKSAMDTAAAARRSVEAARSTAAGFASQAAGMTGALSGLRGALPHLSLNTDPTAPNMNSEDPTPYKQGGGARYEEPTGQGMVLGATVFALAGGAAIKLAVDYLLPTQ